nr:FBP domain-containing protein [Streptomyces sp. CBMA152]
MPARQRLCTVHRVEPLTENTIRSSFVNCTKGEARRLRLPLDFAETPWQDLDFLGWVDPGAPLRAHLVIPRPDGPLGITLRVPGATRTSAIKSSICQVCLTAHASSGVSLLAAPLAGARGREGNTVGIYVCADLACSLYVRGKRQPKLRAGRPGETLGFAEKVARTMENLDAFVAKVVATADSTPTAIR